MSVVAWPFSKLVVKHRYQIFGTVALLAGLAATVLLAFVPSTETSAASQSALLVVVSAIFQGAGVYLFNRGHPSLMVVNTAVRHIAKIGQNIADARRCADTAVDNGTAPVTKAAVGELSVRLEFIYQQVETNLEDWVRGYPDILTADDVEENK